jgi:hypothetical protein
MVGKDRVEAGRMEKTARRYKQLLKALQAQPNWAALMVRRVAWRESE